MALNFPASPDSGDTFTSGSRTWTYDGTSWACNGESAGVADGNKGSLTVSGATWTINAGAVTNAMLAGSIAQSKITDLTTDLALKAPLISPSFTTPALGTPTSGTLGMGAITLTGTKAQFQTAMTDDDFVTLAGTQTITGDKTFSGSVTTADITSTTGDFSRAVTAARGTAGLGTVSVSGGSPTVVTGVDTDFLSRFIVGDTITPTLAATRTIDQINSDTQLQVTVAYSGAVASTTYAHLAASASVNPSGEFKGSQFTSTGKITGAAISGTTGTFSSAISCTNLTASGTVTFANDVYHKSTEGQNRIYFEASGGTYYKAPNGAGHYFVDQTGNLMLNMTLASAAFPGTLAVTGAATITGAITTASYIAGAEMAAPAAPAANGYRIYAEDNGAGKTRLMVLFASGAAQQIAIEP